MKVSFLDLRVRGAHERRELLKAVETVLRHGRIVLGPEVAEFEKKAALFCERKFAVGVNSGTDALFLGLKSLGIGRGDEVITTSLSWIATANAIVLTGATPVFADIRDDLNIDPDSVDRLITSATKAILPVHYTGKICNMTALMQIARKHKLFLIEDASQAFGATYNGKKAGSFGDIACFSMNPMKVFAACGEAGMILTDKEEFYKKLIILRYNGVVNKEKCIEPSLNGRLDTIQAAILLKRLKFVKKIIQKRRKIAAWYNRQLSEIVRIPREAENEKDVFYTYTIQAEDRDRLKAFLEKKGIETKIQHPYPMPLQPAYMKKAKGEFSNASRMVKKILCIPINEKLTKTEIEYISSCIRKFYKRG